MKIPDAHLQMVSKECTNFQKNYVHPFLKTCVDKIMSTDGDRD